MPSHYVREKEQEAIKSVNSSESKIEKPISYTSKLAAWTSAISSSHSSLSNIDSPPPKRKLKFL